MTNARTPQIMYLDAHKEKQYIDVTRVVSVGFGENCDVQIPKAVEKSSEKHLLFYYEEDEQIYCVKNLSSYPVFVENVSTNTAEELKKDGSMCLGKNNTILIGDKNNRKKNFIIFWKDPDAFEEVAKDLRPLHVDNVEDQLFQDQAAKLKADYFYKLRSKVSPNALEVCKYTARWILNNFKVGSVSIYKKIGGRWRCMASYRHNFKDRRRPSTMMFRKALDDGKPFLAKISGRDIDSQVEIGEESYDPSLSIISSPAKRIGSFPLLMNGVPYGMIYIDAPDEDFCDKSYLLLQRMLEREGIAFVLSGYLAERLEDLGYLKKQFSPLPKNNGWEYLLYTTKSPYPLFLRSHIERSSEIVFLYGNIGDDISTVSKTKAFLDGVLSCYNGSSEEVLNNGKNYVHGINKDEIVRLVQVVVNYDSVEDDLVDNEMRNALSMVEHTHSARIMSLGTLYIYVSKKGKVRALPSINDNEDIALSSFDVGDFIVVSLDRIRPSILDGVNALDVKKYIREAFLLYRKQ